jgi:hypothetical protein
MKMMRRSPDERLRKAVDCLNRIEILGSQQRLDYVHVDVGS